MTDKDQFSISRRQAVAAFGTVGVASAGAGLGTTAYFNDTETVDGNTMAAGQLDLVLDWQQTYNGEPVNAYPDHDGNDWQSLGSNAVGVDGDTYYAGPDADGKTAEDIPNVCQNLESGDDLPSDVFEGPDEQQHLIELGDVKPGDSGEVTFSLHLCGNPGYVWMDGVLQENAENGINEPESAVDDDGTGELADEMLAQVWYDLDCDNVRDGDEVLIAQGSIAEVLGELSDGGYLLDNRVYEDAASQTELNQTDSNDAATCSPLGKVETDGDNQNFVATGENVENVSSDGDTYTVTFDPDSETIAVEITVTERKESGEIVAFEYDFPDGYGVCRVDVKGGTGVNRYEYEACTDSDSGLKPPFNPGGQQAAVSYVEFSYCETDGNGVPPDDGEDACIPNSHTRCVGFEWWLPIEVGNEVQSDSVAFDLGFYTEQCRHNDGTRSQ